jgi:hypothetical protein
MIYILILLTSGTHAMSNTGYEFASLAKCQTALAAVEELSSFGHSVKGVCVLK